MLDYQKDGQTNKKDISKHTLFSCLIGIAMIYSSEVMAEELTTTETPSVISTTETTDELQNEYLDDDNELNSIDSIHSEPIEKELNLEKMKRISIRVRSETVPSEQYMYDDGQYSGRLERQYISREKNLFVSLYTGVVFLYK